MNDCSWSSERFEAFLDGTLGPIERARLRAHLEGCRACDDLLAEYRVVDALMLATREIDLPANFTFATMAEVRDVPVPVRRRFPLTAAIAGYLVLTWAAIAAWFVISGPVAHAVLTMTVDYFSAVGSILNVASHGIVRAAQPNAGPLTAVVGGAIALDVALIAAFAIGFARYRSSEAR